MVLEELMDRFERKLEDPISRRNLIRGAFRSSLYSGMGILGAKGLKANNRNTTQPKDTVPLSDSNPSSPVKKFAYDITTTAENLVPEVLHSGDGNGIGSLTGGLLSFAIAARPDKDFATMLYLSSGIGALINRILDDYSTISFSKATRDPRFAEYGFGQIYVETNPYLPAHPTTRDILSPNSLGREVKNVVFGTIYLPAGFEATGHTPIVVYHNLRLAHEMQLAMRIGDEVKARLARGYSDDQVRDYLSNLERRKLKI